tara:strand:- start:268 stop:399 length:132 start_codon:yes stop_codon:yes gene_type:complete
MYIIEVNKENNKKDNNKSLKLYFDRKLVKIKVKRNNKKNLSRR